MSAIHSSSDRSASPPLVVRAYLDVIRARERLDSMLLDLFKHHPACRGHALSLPKYNVLRILRGAQDPEGGLACQEIGRRMVTRVPDVTRLVDRLESSGLVRRERFAQDRRVVLIWPTQAALDLLEVLDEPVLDLHRQQFNGLSDGELETLIDLMQRIVEPD